MWKKVSAWPDPTNHQRPTVQASERALPSIVQRRIIERIRILVTVDESEFVPLVELLVFHAVQDDQVANDRCLEYVIQVYCIIFKVTYCRLNGLEVASSVTYKSADQQCDVPPDLITSLVVADQLSTSSHTSTNKSISITNRRIE